MGFNLPGCCPVLEWFKKPREKVDVVRGMLFRGEVNP